MKKKTTNKQTNKNKRNVIFDVIDFIFKTMLIIRIKRLTFFHVIFRVDF